jgi:hypothetical protein
VSPQKEHERGQLELGEGLEQSEASKKAPSNKNKLIKKLLIISFFGGQYLKTQ